MSELLIPQFDQRGVHKEVSVTLNIVMMLKQVALITCQYYGRSFNIPVASKTSSSASSSNFDCECGDFCHAKPLHHLT